MQYLASWHMQPGATLLRNTNAPLAWVAQEVGYDSEASLGKAIKRLVGSTPGRGDARRVRAENAYDALHRHVAAAMQRESPKRLSALRQNKSGDGKWLA